MKNADVKVGATKRRRPAGSRRYKKKSPGQRPGRSFLQEEVYQTHTPFVKGHIQHWHASATPPRLTESPAKFRRCGAAPHSHPPST